jgi:hypothetical protein
VEKLVGSLVRLRNMSGPEVIYQRREVRSPRVGNQKDSEKINNSVVNFLSNRFIS